MAKVLVADDSALVRMKCSRALSESGHQVIEAVDGIEAIEKYKECKPDVVLLDVIMPEMHGLMALHEIRKIDPVARIAMLTVMGQKIIVATALKEGAREFVVKPFRESRVVDTVHRLLGNDDLGID